MYKPSTDWNPKQKRLREIIREQPHFTEAMGLCRELHEMAHLNEVFASGRPTLADAVVSDLEANHYAMMPTPQDVTIAWNVWHIARIEDATMNLLVADGNQILDRGWMRRLGTDVADTGNAMSDDEIIAFSESLDIAALWEYRGAVAHRSREILDALTPPDLARRFYPEQKERLTAEGCLTAHPDSIWLADFWCKKDVVGILLLPLTRHQAGHLNDCLKLKKKIMSKRA